MPQGPLTNPTSSQASANVSTASDATTANHNDIMMDIDEGDSGPTLAQLSNTRLQSEKAECQKERDERLKNGNIVFRKEHKVGKKQDSLIHRLVIERVGVKADSQSCPVYYCIGCDESVKNIARDRSLPHAYSCMVSTLLLVSKFKDTFQLQY